MKTYPLILALAALLVPQLSFGAEEMPNASGHNHVASTGGHSPHETISGSIGGNRRDGVSLTIVYGRPYTKSPSTGEVRKIWGALIPWDQPYRLGADEATLLATPVSLEVGGKTIPAGAYTLYMIPSATGPSKLGFSTKVGVWGVPVDQSHTVGLFPLEKKTLDNSVDQLTLSIVNDPATPGGGFIRIAWENTEYSLPLKVVR